MAVCSHKSMCIKHPNTKMVMTKNRVRGASFLEHTSGCEKNENRPAKTKKRSRNEPKRKARKMPPNRKAEGGLFSFAESCDGSSIEEVACSLTNRIDRLDKSRAVVNHRSARTKTVSASTEDGLSAQFVSQADRDKATHSEKTSKRTVPRRRNGRSTETRKPLREARSSRQSALLVPQDGLLTETTGPAKRKRCQTKSVAATKAQPKLRNKKAISSFLLIDSASSTCSKPRHKKGGNRQHVASESMDSKGSSQENCIPDENRRKVTFASDSDVMEPNETPGNLIPNLKKAGNIVAICQGRTLPGTNRIEGKPPHETVESVKQLRQPRDPSPRQHGTMDNLECKPIRQASCRRQRLPPRDPTPCKTSVLTSTRTRDPPPVKIDSRNQVGVHSFRDTNHNRSPPSHEQKQTIAGHCDNTQNPVFVDSNRVRGILQETPGMHDDSISTLTMTPAIMPKDDPPCADVDFPINLNLRGSSSYASKDTATDKEVIQAAEKPDNGVDHFKSADEMDSHGNKDGALPANSTPNANSDEMDLATLSIIETENCPVQQEDTEETDDLETASYYPSVSGSCNTGEQESGMYTELERQGCHNKSLREIHKDAAGNEVVRGEIKSSIAKRKRTSKCNSRCARPRRSRRERTQTERFTFPTSDHVSSTEKTKQDLDDNSKRSDDLAGDDCLGDSTTVGRGGRSGRQRQQADGFPFVDASRTESPKEDKADKLKCLGEFAGDECPGDSITDGGRRSRRERKQTDRFTFPIPAHAPNTMPTKDGITERSNCSNISAGDEYINDSTTEDSVDLDGEGNMESSISGAGDQPATQKILENPNHEANAAAPTNVDSRKHIANFVGRPPTQRRTLRAFKLHVPALKSKYVSDDVPEWSKDQLDLLRAAHASVLPTTRSFWWEVSAHVDGKTAKECREMWFSFSTTPKLKERKPTLNTAVDDDLFQSTPMRALCPSKMINPAILNVDKPPKKQGSTRCDSTAQQSPLPPVLARGYKGYLNNMRKDVARAQKAKGKKIATKKESSRVLSEYDASADILVRLTPSGTLRVQHNLHESGASTAVFDEDNSTMTE